MKVLLINKFHYPAGGAERYVADWAQILRAHGHDVMFFSMQHPSNPPCAEEEWFAPEVRFDLDQSPAAKLTAAARSVWSFGARKSLRRLLRARGAPDIAHLNSFMFQLTPSILTPLAEQGVPVIQTCHEYAHICVNQHLYNHRTNRVCEQCLEHGRAAPLWTRCIKGSFAASAAGCAAGVVDVFLSRSRDRIRRFVTPGSFMREKYIQGGMPAERVHHVPNPLAPDWIAPGDNPGDYILFLGRLVPHKGIMTFIEAARRAPGVPCRIAGGGPLEDAVRTALDHPQLRSVTLLGRLQGDALKDAIRNARAIVVPSEWYDPYPYVILEAMLAGRAVIASDIAGPAEMVRQGVDGLLFPPRNAVRLAEEMRVLWREPERAMAMGECGRERVLTENAPDLHYRRLMQLYEDVRR